jgi:hypothetical protein
VSRDLGSLLVGSICGERIDRRGKRNKRETTDGKSTILCDRAVGEGGLSRGGAHGCGCRWGPVPLAVGHDLACLFWNSSYMGSKHYLLCLSFYY